MSCTPARWQARMTLSGSTSPKRAMFSAIEPSNSSMSWGR
jgi:hypothetical protein